MEWNIYKWVPSQEKIKMPRIQNHFSHIWYDVLLFTFVMKLVFKPHIVPNFRSFRILQVACGYGLEDNCGDPNHHRSIKRGCLTQFSNRRLYTQPKVVEIIFYHRLHTWANGEPPHGKHDLDSIAQPSFFSPRMSQALQDHIWTQLGLGYTVKQIYA